MSQFVRTNYLYCFVLGMYNITYFRTLIPVLCCIDA